MKTRGGAFLPRASGRCEGFVDSPHIPRGLACQHKAGGVTGWPWLWEDLNDYNFTVIWEEE